MDFSGNPAFVNKTIPAERIFDSETQYKHILSDVTWLMSIKPGIRDVSKHIDGRIVMEEINVFSVDIGSLPVTGIYLSVIRQIYSSIPYPLVVFFHFGEKYKITAWKFFDSIRKQNHNILTCPYVSSWIREPPVSEKTKKCVSTIKSILLNGTGDLLELYSQICQAILNAQPQTVGSKKQMSDILAYMVGKSNINSILKTLDSKVYYNVKNPGASIYKREYDSSYKYAYEYEDIWAALLQNEKTKRFIENGRYRDPEDLIQHIDMKLEEAGY